MKILNDNVLYDFTVEHDTSFTPNPSITDRRLFRVGFTYRKFEHHRRQPVSVHDHSFDLPRAALDQVNANHPLLSEILSTLVVPLRVQDDLATHFKFRIDTIGRRFSRAAAGVIPVSVRLDVKEIPVERATGIRSRMESARAEDVRAPPRRRVVVEEEEDDDDEMVPARRSAIDGLEKVTGGKGQECAICLEELREGVEVVKMPCCHFYHTTLFGVVIAMLIKVCYEGQCHSVQDIVDPDCYSAIDLANDCITTVKRFCNLPHPKSPKFYFKHPKSHKSIEVGCDRLLLKMFELCQDKDTIEVEVIDSAQESELWKSYLNWLKDELKRERINKCVNAINKDELGDDDSNSELFLEDNCLRGVEQEIISAKSPPLTFQSQLDTEANPDRPAAPPQSSTQQLSTAKRSRKKKKPRGLNLIQGASSSVIVEDIHTEDVSTRRAARKKKSVPQTTTNESYSVTDLVNDSPIGTFTAPLESSERLTSDNLSVGNTKLSGTAASANAEMKLVPGADRNAEDVEKDEEPYFSDDSWHHDDAEDQVYNTAESDSESDQPSDEEEIEIDELNNCTEGGEFSGDEEEGVGGRECYLSAGKPFQAQADGTIRLETKQMFLNKKQFLEAIRDYAVQEGVDLHRLANDPDKYTVKCNNMDTCNWRLHASRLPDKVTFMIKTIKGEHTCSRLSENPMASQAWVMRKILPELRANASMPPKTIQIFIQKKYGATVNYQKCFRAKRDAMQYISGNHVDSYAKLLQYAKIALERNPGSIIDLKYQEYLNGPPTFSRMFICFSAMREGFVNGCRPFLGVDGCHLKGPFGGVLLSAVAIDGNNGIFPVAFAVVASETVATWTYFFSNLKLIATADIRSKWVIISDRQKGVEPALEAVLPEVQRRICSRHLYANFKKDNPGPLLRNLFWEATQCFTTAALRDVLRRMQEQSPRAFGYVKNVDYRLWVRLHMPAEVKVIETTSNFVEAFNSKLRDIRGSPMLNMLEELRRNLMKKMNGRREAINKMGGTVTPYAKKMLLRNAKSGRHCAFTGSSEYEYEVTDSERHHIVNLLQRHCDCMFWDLSGIPCKHACAIMSYKRLDMEQFVDPYFTMKRYALTYSKAIAPIPDTSIWPDYDGIVLAPPFLRKLPGRPKKNRRKEPDEVENKGKSTGTNTCSQCLQPGHNKRSCNSRKNRGQGQGEGLVPAAEGGVGNGPNLSQIPIVSVGNKKRRCGKKRKAAAKSEGEKQKGKKTDMINQS